MVSDARLHLLPMRTKFDDFHSLCRIAYQLPCYGWSHPIVE